MERDDALVTAKGVPYWLDTAVPQHSSSGTLPERVDVAVIGGGLTGLSAALHLARMVRRSP